MKITRLAYAAVLLFTICLSVAAQRRTPAPKPAATPPQATGTTRDPKEVRIALVDTGVFGDEKDGIIRYRDAVKSLELEFKAPHDEIETMKARYETLVKELDTLSKASVVAPESVKAKKEETERVEREIKQKQETAQKALEKRYQEVMTPISRDIGEALTAFAAQRGVTLTLDISKLLPAILTIAPGADLTKEFVADYNSKHPSLPAAARP